MTLPESLLSPRLRALVAAQQAAEPEALAQFWRDVETAGAPLLETVAGQPYATFLWRGAAPASVQLSYGPPAPMHRLPDADLWYVTLPVVPRLQTTYRLNIDGQAQPDPLNPRAFTIPADAASMPAGPETYSWLALPDAAPLPDTTGALAGSIEPQQLASAALGRDCRVWVYTPPGYRPEGERANLVVLFDGWYYWQALGAPQIVDQLIQAGELPPVVLVLVDNPHAARAAELGCSLALNRFVMEELLPWLFGQYTITKDAVRTVIGGFGLGGVAATYLAYRHPHTFGGVLAQSATYGWLHPAEPEPGWLIRQFVVSENLNLRFALSVGFFERDMDVHGSSTLGKNRHMRDVLRAKGYPVAYLEYPGGCDYINWQPALAKGLVSLLAWMRRSGGGRV